MFSNDTRTKLESIVGGKVIKTAEDSCTATRNLLCASFRTSTTVKKDFEGQSVIKEEQAGLLRSYCRQKGLWVQELPGEHQFLARGGEAKVYMDRDNRTVIKLNDAVYYATWLEFFNSLVIHNTLFKETAYTFVGFTEKDNSLQAILRQPFITSDAPVELAEINALLVFNDFENTRRNDYYNKELGLILGDMHDENDISSGGDLYFIDTVFYTVSANP